MYIIKTKRCLKYLLEREARRGRLLDLEGVPRGIGKTSLLVSKAKKYVEQTGEHCYIAEPEILQAHYLNRKYHNEDMSKLIEFVGVLELCPQALKGGAYHDLAMFVDEGVKPEVIKILWSNFDVRAGYIGKHMIHTPHARIEYQYVGDGLLKALVFPTI